MTVPNNYEINIATPPTPQAKYGEHFCKVELRDCSAESTIEKYKFLKDLFPADWNLQLYEVTCYRTVVNV